MPGRTFFNLSKISIFAAAALVLTSFAHNQASRDMLTSREFASQKCENRKGYLCLQLFHEVKSPGSGGSRASRFPGGFIRIDSDGIPEFPDAYIRGAIPRAVLQE